MRRALRVCRVWPVFLGLPALRALLAFPAQSVRRVKPALLVLRVLPVRKGRRVKPALLVPRVPLAHKDLRAKPGHKVPLVHKDRKVSLALPAPCWAMLVSML